LERAFERLPNLERCPRCGLLVRADRDSVENANVRYEEAEDAPGVEGLTIQESRREAYYRDRASRISAICGEPGSLLEIGVGTGGLLGVLKEKGWRVEGVEPSERLCLLARQAVEPDGVVHFCRLDEADSHLEGMPYRAIVALDVLEHLPDPWLLPRRAHQWLEGGGWFFLQTPNSRSLRLRVEGADWQQLAPEEHFVIHSNKSLEKLLRASGFSSVCIKTLSGTAADRAFRRSLMRPVGGVLNLFGMGNALWASARKPER